MPRPKNFQASTRISWNISKEAAQMLRVASAQTGLSPAAVLDTVIRRGLHLVIESSDQVVGDNPAPLKAPAPARANSPRGHHEQNTDKPKRNGHPISAAAPGSTPWTPDTLLDLLKHLRRERPELAAALGLKNIHIWWSPGKGVTPSIPPGRWGQIDQVLQGWGWVKP